MNIKKTQFITALAATASGDIIEIEGYGAVGMAGSYLVPLTMKNTIPMPYGGELMLLPDRIPIFYNIGKRRTEAIYENPYNPQEPIFPVALFNSPGYVNSYLAAHKKRKQAKPLPLFSYAAAGYYGNGFRTCAICVDKEPRQDLRRMAREKVVKGVKKMQKIMPDNRLRKHLEKCALEYGCPAGKNFFLGRYEAPLPTSKTCNADCLGCISFQKNKAISCSQERIAFTPTPNEIAQIALTHISRVKKAVVSFGQGCEGDPLMAEKAIIPAIKIIRKSTGMGTININTNAGRPDILEKMFDAGLDSVRVSINSVREKFYNAYFRPKSYGFSHVLKSIDIALERKKFVSINYLNMPGFTDTPGETDALSRFIKNHPIHMIQWRNLNFDPLLYIREMKKAGKIGVSIGMTNVLKRIGRKFPNLIYGYFNPPKEKWPWMKKDGQQ